LNWILDANKTPAFWADAPGVRYPAEAARWTTIRRTPLEISAYTVAEDDSKVSVTARLWQAIASCLIVVPMAVFPRLAFGQNDDALDARTQAATATPGKKAPSVNLGQLLRLPDSYHQRQTESRRGMNQFAWESRFEVVRLDLSTAQGALEKAQTELGEVADDSSQWSVAAPGTTPNPENTPLSYKLRQEIRRQREEVKRTERNLRALEIEADLAEVPVDWRALECAAQLGVNEPRRNRETLHRRPTRRNASPTERWIHLLVGERSATESCVNWGPSAIGRGGQPGYSAPRLRAAAEFFESVWTAVRAKFAGAVLRL